MREHLEAIMDALEFRVHWLDEQIELAKKPHRRKHSIALLAYLEGERTKATAALEHCRVTNPYHGV